MDTDKTNGPCKMLEVFLEIPKGIRLLRRSQMVQSSPLARAGPGSGPRRQSCERGLTSLGAPLPAPVHLS